jgi:F-box/leucine-rich repeat protein 14
LTKLPEELCAKVFKLLEVVELFRATFVCKKWRKVSEAFHPELYKLTHLDVSGDYANITDRGVKNLVQKFTALTSLDISNSVSLSEKSLKHIVKNIGSRLTTLKMGNLSNVPSTGLKYVPRLDNLLELDITKSSRIGETGMKTICHLPKITALNLSACSQLSDRTLPPVATMTTLTSLDMSSCYDVDDEAVLIVSKLPQLKSLSLSYTDISDGAVAIICGGQVKRKDDKNKTVLIDYPPSNLTTLEHLYLAGTDISNKALGLLAQSLPNLKHLDLSWCARIRDEGVLALSALKNLKFLGLDFTRVSRKGIEPLLKSLPNLKLIQISNTKISKKGFRIIKKATPSLHIETDFLAETS